MALSKREYRQLQKTISRALKRVLESAKHEPSTVIITGEPNGESETIIEEITQWLFHGRDEDGSSGN